MTRRPERRKAPRVESNTPARIRLPGRPRTLPCIVHNLSSTGARITAENCMALPDRFSLELAEGGARDRDCLVRWRTKSGLGVSFVNVAAAQPKPPLARAQTHLATA